MFSWRWSQNANLSKSINKGRPPKMVNIFVGGPIKKPSSKYRPIAHQAQYDGHIYNKKLEVLNSYPALLYFPHSILPHASLSHHTRSSLPQPQTWE
jgi:hypothetical protein